MSLLDIQNQFTGYTVPTGAVSQGDTMIASASGTPYLATNIIDMWNGLPTSATAVPKPPLGGPQIVDFGRGRPMLVMTEILVTCVGSGATVTFQLVTADDTSIGTAVTVHQQTAAIPVNTLVQGYKPYLPMLNAGLNRTTTNRYLALRWVLATAALTAGAFFSGLAVDDATNVPAF